MSDAPRLSVVVASHGRPDALKRCLLGLHQQRNTSIEVIVVADRQGRDAVRTLPFADRIKQVGQDLAHLSQARNAGLAQAAGDIVAFVDDDAVPEPMWAAAHLAAFRDPDLVAATGPVLGRNGISVQWGKLHIDATGRDRPVPGDAGTGAAPRTGLKLHGTNMAFRRDYLRDLGGFDPAFAYFLDDTDVAWRIARTGGKTVFVDTAIVHHAFAASARRRQDRVPLSLFDIGASTAVYLRKHAPDAVERDLARLRIDQEARLRRMHHAGRLKADETVRLLSGLAAGIAAGIDRGFGDAAPMPAVPAFVPLRDASPAAMRVMAGWTWQAGRLRAAAAAEIAQDRPVTLFLFEPTPRKHRVVFTDGGWWEQTGGLFGPADRREPRLRFARFQERMDDECRRVGPLRGFENGADHPAPP